MTDLTSRVAAIQLRRFAGPAAYVGRLTHLRVAHLTDLHVGAVTPTRVQRAAVALTNTQAPDLILMSGDFVCHSLAHLDELESVIGALQAPAIAVLGNHDHWSGAAAVRRALERAGAAVLVNRHTTVTLRGQTHGEVSGMVVLVALAVALSATYFWEYSLDQATWTSVPPTMKVTAVVSGLTPGKVYYFRLRTLTRKGEGNYSDAVSLMVH